MATSRIHLFALLAAFIAALMALSSLKGLLLCLAGLTILIALFAYDQRGARSGGQSLAFAFVCGLALFCCVSYPVTELGLTPSAVANEFPAIVWVVATVAFWLIDRARMSSRRSGPVSAYTQQQIFALAPQPVPERAFVPAPMPASPAAPPEPATNWNVRAPEPPVESEPVSTPTPMTTPVPAPAAPEPIRSGKEVSIYVNMLDEGMNVLRAVRAEHLGRDFYVIVDEMPADEKWEYSTGQVVRCKKKNLSSGKGLVAYEEAPRAQ